jgi:hypothetical protein
MSSIAGGAVLSTRRPWGRLKLKHKQVVLGKNSFSPQTICLGALGTCQTNCLRTGSSGDISKKVKHHVFLD